MLDITAVQNTTIPKFTSNEISMLDGYIIHFKIRLGRGLFIIPHSAVQFT